MSTAERKEDNLSREQAAARLEGIKEMVAALECDYERLEELKDERDSFDAEVDPDDIPEDHPVQVMEHGGSTCGTCGLSWDDDVITSMTPVPSGRCPFESFHKTWESENPEDAEELRDLIEAAGDCTDREGAEQRIMEDSLEISVRSDWHTPGDSDGAKPGQFMILLCTGGPAVRIVGELNEYSEPYRAWLEHQDWFTPWQEYYATGDDQKALLTYCRCFYFGE